MNKKGIILFLLAVVCSISVNAQSHKGLRINEVMVQNDSNLVDEYGNRSAWIELYNSTRRTMNISSIYITTQKVEDGQLPDRNQMYLVPRGDERTKVKHLQAAVFFADEQPQKGTFHTSIKLIPGQENYIAVYDADCITKLDEVVVPANLPAGCSFARNTKIEDFCKLNGNSFIAGDWSVRNGEAEQAAAFLPLPPAVPDVPAGRSVPADGQVHPDDRPDHCFQEGQLAQRHSGQ